RNTIIAQNGSFGPDGTLTSAEACAVVGAVTAVGSGNLIQDNSGCPGVVSTADPQLGPLQMNAPGNTPTMAIPTTSPAYNTADSATSLSTDQRGVYRPQRTTFDIGAYERCVAPTIGAPECIDDPVVRPPDPT